MYRNPNVFTGTCHRIGATYRSHYWRDTYTVVGHGSTPGSVLVRRSDGELVEHLTRLSYKDERLDAVEMCSMHLEDLQRSGW